MPSKIRGLCLGLSAPRHPTRIQLLGRVLIWILTLIGIFVVGIRGRVLPTGPQGSLLECCVGDELLFQFSGYFPDDLYVAADNARRSTPMFVNQISTVKAPSFSMSHMPRMGTFGRNCEMNALREISACTRVASALSLVASAALRVSQDCQTIAPRVSEDTVLHRSEWVFDGGSA
jgi:hypothetical protein